MCDDGCFKSTPFHVRFGKLQGVLQPREKVVTVTVNESRASFFMKVGSGAGAHPPKSAPLSSRVPRPA